MSWSWPQYVILSLMILSTIVQSLKFYKDPNWSGWWVVASIVLNMGATVMYGWVLHEGGFW